jgi:hypothetical protein
VICPWCMHCGPYDEDYVFDDERYCGICARQMPRGREAWLQAFEVLTPEMAGTVEHELNKIGWGRSGLQPEVVAGIGDAIDAFARLRTSDKHDLGRHSAEEFARWLDFACTYFPPG